MDGVRDSECAWPNVSSCMWIESRSSQGQARVSLMISYYVVKPVRLLTITCLFTSHFADAIEAL